MTLLSRVFSSNEKVDSYSGSLRLTSPILNPSSGASSPRKRPNFLLHLKLESPPVVLYGQPHESTGSIISGIFKLDAHTELDLEKVTLSLVQTIKYSRAFCIPSVSHCKDCRYKKTTLARWDVLTSTANFNAGTHGYPFSHLIPGALPPTSKLGSSSDAYIKYELIATAITPTNLETEVALPLFVSRLLLRGPDKNSLRVFPPTDVTASAVLPNVVYPKSTFPIELKLDNIVSNSRRWRMRKLVWRIEETTSVRTHVCERHESKMKHAIESTKRTPRVGGGSNVHHSTIRTAGVLLENASEHYHGVRQAGAHVNVDAQVADVPLLDHDVDVTESEPTHVAAVDSVNEDFPMVSIGGSGPLRLSPVAPGSTPVVSVAARSGLTPVVSAPARSGANSPGGLTPISSGVNSPGGLTPVRSATAPGSNASLHLEEIRTISHGEYRSGWKSDFSNKGHIELVAEISAKNISTGRNPNITQRSSDDNIPDEASDATVSCDIDDDTLGVFVTHTLIVEIVVAEEVTHSTRSGSTSKGSTKGVTNTTSSDTPTQSTSTASPPLTGVPTGAARVLRMQFKVFLTERSGLGIAWDDEVPPTYQDVHTLSPPIYLEASGAATPVLSPLPSARSAGATPRVLHGVGVTPGLHPSMSIGQAMEEGIQELRL